MAHQALDSQIKETVFYRSCSTFENVRRDFDNVWEKAVTGNKYKQQILKINSFSHLSVSNGQQNTNGERAQSLQEVYTAADACTETFVALVKDLTPSGSPLTIAVVKPRWRALEKLYVKYGVQHSERTACWWLCDVLRASSTCSSLKYVLEVVERLLKGPTKKQVQAKFSWEVRIHLTTTSRRSFPPTS
jgi:hypothetical protein